MLSEDESEVSGTEDLHQLTINEHYAKAFEYRKQREELAKLKEKYGSDFEEDEEAGSDSESDESEDEYGEELTPAVDAALLRTLARIRRKDPEIYDSKVGIFSEEAKRTEGKNLTRTRPSKDRSKPLTIKQQNLAALLESNSPTSTPAPLTHAQEQEALRDETISAFHNAVKDEEDDDLLTLREGVKDEAEQREEEYREFLQREVGEDLSQLMWVEDGKVIVKDDEQEQSEVKTEEKKKKKGKRKERKAETDEEFLMNYILNRGWIDKSEQRAPTYREIVGPEISKPKKEDVKSENLDAAEAEEDNGLLDEDEFDEVADHFESTYNFRFEEPNAHIIATHPRNVTSVRRTDTSRKEARENKKARKAEKMLAKKEEVKRLKALKLREYRDKLEEVRKEGGLGKGKGKQKVGAEWEEDENEDWGALGELDLDGEWDPEKHDAQMGALYDEGGEYEEDNQKPTWADDIDISDLIPPTATSLAAPAADTQQSNGKKKKKKKRKHDGDDENVGVDPDEMDADVEQPAQPEEGEEEWDGTEEMRKRVLDKYMDEIYGLDFNDMVGDMPTHFRYSRVESSTHGLNPVEILMATDAELNSYVGLKRLATYRKEKFDPRRPEKLKEFRKALTARGAYENGWSGQAGEEKEEKVKQRKGKKERQKEKAKAAMEEAIKQEEKAQTQGEEPKKKKRKRKHAKAGSDGTDVVA